MCTCEVNLLYREKNVFNLYLYQKIEMYYSFYNFNPWFKFLISLIDLV